MANCGSALGMEGYGGIPDCVLSLLDDWPTLQHKFEAEIKRQRLLRLTRYRNSLDWTVSLKVQKNTTPVSVFSLVCFFPGHFAWPVWLMPSMWG